MVWQYRIKTRSRHYWEFAGLYYQYYSNSRFEDQYRTYQSINNNKLILDDPYTR